MLTSTRNERDFLGELDIPSDAYWGIHTARAVENFAVAGVAVSTHRNLTAGLGAVKQAAARANRELGLLDPQLADVIDQGSQDVRDGRLDEQFVVDVVQGGAGTSTNMNANEVIANRALERLGLPFGHYDVINACLPGVRQRLDSGLGNSTSSARRCSNGGPSVGHRHPRPHSRPPTEVLTRTVSSQSIRPRTGSGRGVDRMMFLAKPSVRPRVDRRPLGS